MSSLPTVQHQPPVELPPSSPQPEYPPGMPPRPPYRRRRRRSNRAGCVLLLVTFPLFAGFACCLLSFAIGLIIPPPTVLIVGLDHTPTEGDFGRTDSIMLVSVQPRYFRVSLLSFPRDLFIQTPANGLQRINTIHRTAELNTLGSGPQALEQAIELSFDIPVERYVRFDFADFIALVDAVGGVEIDVPRTIVDSNYPTETGGVMTVRFEQGLQWMDGQTALIYARTRQADDDYQRAGRQQQVVRAVARRLLNPFYWPATAHVLLTQIETDVSVIDIWRMIPTLALSGGAFDQLVIDRDYILPGDGYVVPNYDRLRPWLDEHFP